MARLIDADAIPYREIWKEEWLKNAGKFQQGVFKDEIDEMPTVDAVPVIRCKDCKYSKPIDSEWLECQHDKRCMKENGFCSWAERRGEE